MRSSCSLLRLAGCVLFLAAASPRADGAGPSEVTEGEKISHFSRVLKRLPDLQAFLNEWPSEEAASRARDFAAAGHQNPAIREQEWARLDALLGGRAGGEVTPESAAMLRKGIRRLPAKQWYFVVLLEEQRHEIFRTSGPGKIGNIIQDLTAGKKGDESMYGRKCYQRADRLLNVMNIIKDTWRFDRWTGGNVIARIGGRREHTAPCYVYDDGQERLEIVADPWGNALMPAQLWWQQWDDDADKALSGQGDWCGPAYKRWESLKMKELLSPGTELPETGGIPGP